MPRGSNALVKHIQQSTKCPVLGHADGICHVLDTLLSAFGTFFKIFF